LHEPYLLEDATKDNEKLLKVVEEIEMNFQKSGLINIPINRTNAPVEPLEELIRKTNEQINSYHNEIERTKKSILLCQTRILDTL